MHHECIFCNHELVSCFFFLKGEYFYEKMHEKDPVGEYCSCNHLFRRGEHRRMIVCMNTV